MTIKKRIAIRKGVTKLDNSLETGTVFYGLHMSEGLAHYTPPGEEPFTVLLKNETIKRMNPTFAGKPVVVGHIDEYSPISETDGVVAESFYNPVDGKHWSKFIITTQKGLDAIAKGWQLSNSLLVDQHSQGGDWHGLSFDRTVNKGTFHHLAIVPNPRYSESMILTPEQFKQYNKDKQLELEMLSNSKETPMKIFKLFKNEAQDEKKMKELLAMSVVLPTTKRTVTIEQLCNEADEAKPSESSSEDQEIDIDGAKMTLKEFVAMYKKLKAEFDSLEIISEEGESEQLSNSADEESEEESEDDDLDESGDNEEESEDEESEGLSEEDLDAMDAADAEQEKLDNAKPAKPAAKAAAAKPAEKKQAVKKGTNAKKLKNAADKAAAKLNNQNDEVVVELTSDMIKRGAARYGSAKK